MEETNETKANKWGWLVLFTTTSTLLCCALPIVLVSLGMGAVVASVASNASWLIWLTAHKIWVFSLAALLLLISGWALYRPGRSCPANPELGKYCTAAHKWNGRIFWFSVILFLIGAGSAYILPLIY